MARRAHVRSHTRTSPGGGTTRVGAHQRQTKGPRPSPFTLSPGRSGRNFMRGVFAARKRRRLVAGALFTVAAAELVGFATFKTAGGLLVGTGLLLGVVGGALWFSARR